MLCSYSKKQKKIMKDKWLLVVNKTDALLYNYEKWNGHAMSSICVSKEKDSKKWQELKCNLWYYTKYINHYRKNYGKNI